jgi:acyl-CoA reductase-like NAD-dependent aldehyde dehydrogenase
MSVLEAPAANGDTTHAVTNPVTGEGLYEITEASDAQIAEVFARAQQAYEVIRKMTVRQRLDETLKLMHYIRDNRENILDRVMAETGKTRYEALLSEIFTVLDMIEYYDKHAEKMLADKPLKSGLLLMGKKGKIVFEPIGPVLIIQPDHPALPRGLHRGKSGYLQALRIHPPEGPDGGGV